MRNTDFVVTLFEGKSNPNHVTVAVVMGLNALKQGHSATIILMVDAVALGKPNATKGIDIGAPLRRSADNWRNSCSWAVKSAFATPACSTMVLLPRIWTAALN